ncbi:MAG: class I SAM-dependent methyltransferase [Vicingus serpentipes]|nr:class I SAM-dependent methyltransferase [Vicingus serpentipes]
MGTLNSDKAWKLYGKKNPYYGVLAHDEFLDKNLSEENLNQFFETGFSDVEHLFEMLHKNFGDSYKPKTAIDFGCGTGRLVIPLAKRIDKVVGLDISEQMLTEAKKNAEKFGLKNISFYLSDNNLSEISDQKFDLIHSYIVLQHINIKRGEKLIQSMINLLNPNGVGVLQMTYYSNKTKIEKIINFFRYRIPLFNNVLNLFRGKPFDLPLMQMNAYNMNNVLFILQKAGITHTQVIFTNHGGYYGLTLLFQK